MTMITMMMMILLVAVVLTCTNDNDDNDNDDNDNGDNDNDNDDDDDDDNYNDNDNNNNRLPVTNNYHYILAMLIGLIRNGRLEVTQFLVPTTSGTVSVIRRDAKCNTSLLTAPGSLNTNSMCESRG